MQNEGKIDEQQNHNQGFIQRLYRSKRELNVYILVFSSNYYTILHSRFLPWINLNLNVTMFVEPAN